MVDLKIRTKIFAIDCWNVCSLFPNSREYNAYVNQLIRSSSSVGANYRASQRSKSDADFINKVKIVEEEADESQFFLELLYEVNKLNNLELNSELKRLIKESNELVAIFVTIINKKKENINNKKNN
jgi:four helix bundle protein